MPEQRHNFSWYDFIGSCLTMQPEQRIGMVRAWPSIKEWNSDLWGQNVIRAPEEAEERGLKSATGRFSGKQRYYDFSILGAYIKRACKLKIQILPVFEPGIDDLLTEDGQSWKDCVYEQVRYFNSGGFKKYPIIYWQAGNEVNCIEYFNPDKIDLDKEDHWKYFNNLDNAVKYVEFFLAPTIEAIKRASYDIYRDKNRIKVIVGSIANTGAHKSIEWLESVLNTEIEGKYAPTLKGGKVYKHANIISVHYVMGASRKRPGHEQGSEWNELLDYLYNRWLTTEKIEGMWLTEELGGRRNFVGVDIIVIVFRYISWWMRHNWTPLRGGRCFLYGDWWDKDNAPPLGIVVEQLIADYVKDGTLVDFSDNLEIKGENGEIEGYCFKSGLLNGDNFLIAIFAKGYVPVQDAPPPLNISINEVILNGITAYKNKPEISMKIVTPYTVIDCNFRTFHQHDRIRVMMDKRPYDDPHSVFLIFMSFAGNKDDFGYAFKEAREIFTSENNKVLSDKSEILSLHKGNWIGEDWFAGGLDEGMNGDKHALVTRYAEEKPSMKVKLENDYMKYKDVQVEIDYGHCGGAKSAANVYWDGRLLCELYPQEQKLLQRHRQVMKISTEGFSLVPGEHTLEIESTPGLREGDPYWFAVDAIKITGIKNESGEVITS